MSIFAQSLFLSAVFTITLAAQSASVVATVEPRTAPIPKKAFTIGVDEPGCKDSALVARVQGCSILQCVTEADDSTEIPVRAEADGGMKKEEIDGASETLYYLCPATTTQSSIIKASEEALVAAGFALKARSKDGEDDPIITLTKERQWVHIATYPYENMTAYIQTAVLEAQLDAQTIEEQLSQAGRVELYGVKFEAGTAEVGPKFDPVLTSLVAVLAKKPSWRVRIEVLGEDGDELPAAKVLGEKRANALTASLVTKGVAKSRVGAKWLPATAEAEEEKSSRTQIQIVKY